MTVEALMQRNLPKFSEQKVKSLVSELFGISGDYHELVSERDLSWRIKVNGGANYVVKVSNATEAKGVVDFQVKALQHIARQDPDLLVPRMIESKQGNAYEWIEAEDGQRHMIRILTFLSGRVMIDTPEAHNPVTRYNIGAMTGRLATALRNFFHPYGASNVHLWDISRALELRGYLKDVQDVDLRELCSNILDRAENFTLPEMNRTRWQVVHQDAHSGNVLVSETDATVPAGIIDFGDMGYNSIVAEVVGSADNFASGDDPLDNLCHAVAGFDSQFPLEESEIDLCYDGLLLQLAVFSIIVCSRQLRDGSENTHIEDVDTAPEMLIKLYAVGREEAVRRLREACRFPVYAPGTDGEVFENRDDELVEKRETKLGKIWHFYDKPIHFTRAQGGYMYTSDGIAYLDAYNNVPQVGHSHPHVVKAIARQAAALNTNTRYMCDIAADYAERLTADLPEHLDTCIFVNSGSEANDLAMQISKLLSGNQGGIIIENAYHGCTELTTKLSHETWGALPKEKWPDDIELLREAGSYRGPYVGDPQAAEKYAADADAAIASLADKGYNTAAFMVDTAMCAHGLVTVPANYFNLVAEKTHAAGGFVIADEVQAGLGRMGQFWGFRANGLKDENVDFITMGKPVGNAHPLGVIILSSKLLAKFLDGSHPMLFSTFGGNAVACAAGMAVLDVIEREQLVEKSNRIGDYIRDGLRSLAKQYPVIGDVRGKGMMIGLEFVTDSESKTPAIELTDQVVNAMFERKVMIGKGSGNVLKLRPSLAWNEAEADLFIEQMGQSLAQICQ
ncbi:aminotransferase class III-fold pyridoxal phosphate-dependent enzyme [Vibrio sp.]|uniref:aminotransferase class III-fold pyridoxal phosphate-dependent enzyme n=1 Tax=Vibrio sp. TaxID=678 RepID=UPI003D14F0E9